MVTLDKPPSWQWHGQVPDALDILPALRPGPERNVVVAKGLDDVRVLGVTLARGGSKGIPGKNIRPVLGKPLLAYTVEEALLSRRISRYVVSTDSLEIAAVAREWGAECIERPKELAGDTTPSLDALRHAVFEVEKQEGVPYDIVVELRVTNPLKTVDDIDGAIEKLIDTRADSVIGVSLLEDHHPARIKKLVDDRIVDFVMPEPRDGQRQLLRPDAYIRNGSIYAVRRDLIMNGAGQLFNHRNSRPWIMSAEKSINIDTELDFLLVEALLKRQM